MHWLNQAELIGKKGTCWIMLIGVSTLLLEESISWKNFTKDKKALKYLIEFCHRSTVFQENIHYSKSTVTKELEMNP